MNYDEKEYIIYEEGMIVEEIDKLDKYTLNKKVDPQNNDATHRSEIEVDCRSVKSESGLRFQSSTKNIGRKYP